MTEPGINRIPSGGMNAAPLKSSRKYNNTASLPVDSFALSSDAGKTEAVIDPRKAAEILTSKKALVCEKLWEYESGATVVSSPARGPNGIVSFGSREDKKLFGVDEKTGKVKWTAGLKGKIHAAPTWDADGTLYLGDSEKRVYALDGDTGKEKWKFKTRDYVNTSPKLTQKGTLLVEDGGNNIYAIDSKTGKKQWEFKPKDSGPPNPFPGPDGKVYIRSGKREFKAVDEKTGKVERTYTTETDIKSNHFVGADGTIYFAGDRHCETALDGNTGKTKWTGKKNEGGTAIQGPGNTLITGVLGEGFDVLDMDTGNKLWGFQTGDYLTGPPVLGPDDNIYLNSYDGNTYAFNPKGQKLWEIKPGGFPSGSPAPGTDGIMYVISGKGKLAAYMYNKSLYAGGLMEEMTAEAGTGDTPDGKPGTIEKGKGFVEIGGVRLEVKERDGKL